MPILEAKLANAGLLKKIVESIKDLVTDAPFDCSETGMSLQAMDSSHVAVVSLKLKVGFFDKYKCDGTINLGISLSNMSKALKCANNHDTCTLKYQSDDIIDIKFKDTELDKTHQVTLKMMNIDSEKLGIPEQKYDVVCEMPAKEFERICKDMVMFSDSLNITAEKSEITFTGNGDIGTSVVTYSPSINTNDAISLEINESVNENFSLKYINHFTKATPLSDRVRISICKDALVVEYWIQESGYLKFYLAPRIDEDEEMD